MIKIINGMWDRGVGGNKWNNGRKLISVENDWLMRFIILFDTPGSMILKFELPV